jgi:glycosyltransferase involved in cell wall biosynthesis
MEVILLSLARNILEKGSRERLRMAQYANKLDGLHIVVLTQRIHGYTKNETGNMLSLYPTHSKNRLCMLFDAFCIVQKIMKGRNGKKIVISAQDPFEIGWLSYIVARITKAHFHVQIHGDYFNNGWCGYSPIRWIKRYFARILIQRAYSIRVVSERIKRSLLKHHIDATRIRVLPIRPELESFLSHSVTPHVDGTPFIFLYVGRFSSEKNIQRILNAFSEVYTHHTHVRLRLVGSGKEEQVLKKRVKKLGIHDVVTFISWTQTIPEEMAKAHVCVLASKHEAYGLVLLEAMAVGVPLITTDVGCVGDIVHDGIHGIVVPQKSVSVYTHAMMRMVSDTVFWTQCIHNEKDTVRMICAETQDMYVEKWVNTLLCTH